MILEPITIQPRPLTDRLWRLVDKEAAGTISPMETIELNCLCLNLEAEQDNAPRHVAPIPVAHLKAIFGDDQ